MCLRCVSRSSNHQRASAQGFRQKLRWLPGRSPAPIRTGEIHVLFGLRPSSLLRVRPESSQQFPGPRSPPLRHLSRSASAPCRCPHLSSLLIQQALLIVFSSSSSQSPPDNLLSLSPHKSETAIRKYMPITET